MTRSFLDPETDDVRRRLPVAAVLERHGMEPANAAGRYWCPWHPDKRPGGKPSADVWETEEGERLQCWSCGEGADALELLAELGRKSPRAALAEAMEIVSQLPEEDSDPRLRRTPRPIPVGRLELELERTTTGIRWPRDADPLREFAAARRRKGHALASLGFLREWGWAGDYRGRLLIPHRRIDGTISGLRYRIPPGWSRGARPLSQFRQLYGCWRPAVSTASVVWLLEGETDTTLAAENLEPRGAAALGVTTAAMKVRPDELQLLKGRRVVFFAHGDHAGQAAARRWRMELKESTDRFLTYDLPEGEDLCSAGIPLQQIWKEIRARLAR